MSSNEKMVMIPRELVEQAMLACFEAGFGIPHDALRKVLQSADQPHGEPVALPGRREEGAFENRGDLFTIGWNAYFDEIAKLGPLYTRPVQGEPVAWRYQTHAGGLWYLSSSEHNARMFENAEKGSCVEPLYTHADAGEVERLRYKAELYDEVWELATGLGYMNVTTAISTLRAQLAERDAKACAMLELAVEALKDLDHKSDWVEGVQTDIERYLSASAEPSAPKFETCKSCHGEGVIHTGIEESPTTLCNRCDGSGNEPKPEACCGSCPAGCVISASEAKCETCDGHGAVGNILNAEPCPDCSYSAPVERDERAAFERRFPDFDHTLCSHEDWKDQYEDPKLGDMWNGWQARAALERKP